MKRRAVAIAVASALSATAALAGAQPVTLPAADVCATEAHTLHAYQSGWQSGQSVVAAAMGAGPCAALPGVERAVANTLSRLVVPKQASEQVRCRARGLVDGAERALDTLRRSCADGGP
jgi:hypothetical protein